MDVTYKSNQMEHCVAAACLVAALPSVLQNVNGADADRLPTHLRAFSSLAEYKLVRKTYVQLLHSNYYWRSMTMEEAHRALAHAQLGTFLIR